MSARPTIVTSTEETSQQRLDRLQSSYIRISAHALLDQLLDQHPETSVVLIAVDGKKIECASIPNALSVKLGIIDTLYDVIHPETAE